MFQVGQQPTSVSVELYLTVFDSSCSPYRSGWTDICVRLCREMLAVCSGICLEQSEVLP